MIGQLVLEHFYELTARFLNQFFLVQSNFSTIVQLNLVGILRVLFLEVEAVEVHLNIFEKESPLLFGFSLNKVVVPVEIHMTAGSKGNGKVRFIP